MDKGEEGGFQMPGVYLSKTRYSSWSLPALTANSVTAWSLLGVPVAYQ